MLAIEINPEYLRRLDKVYPEILRHIEKENPDIYKDNDCFCCISGKSEPELVFGKGPTMHEALEDWENNLLRKVDTPTFAKLGQPKNHKGSNKG